MLYFLMGWRFLVPYVWFETEAICSQLIKMKDSRARTDISFDMPSYHNPLDIMKLQTMVIKTSRFTWIVFFFGISIWFQSKTTGVSNLSSCSDFVYFRTVIKPNFTILLYTMNIVHIPCFWPYRLIHYKLINICFKLQINKYMF